MLCVIWIKRGESDVNAGSLVLDRTLSQRRDVNTNAQFGAERRHVWYFHHDHGPD
jgi:hypothetical protein